MIPGVNWYRRLVGTEVILSVDARKRGNDDLECYVYGSKTFTRQQEPSPHTFGYEQPVEQWLVQREKPQKVTIKPPASQAKEIANYYQSKPVPELFPRNPLTTPDTTYTNVKILHQLAKEGPLLQAKRLNGGFSWEVQN